MKLTATVNCSGVYSDEALRGLWEAADNCPTVGNIVEIGCEYGRSTSLLAQIAKERNQYLVLIDPFVKHLDGTPGSSVAQSIVKMLVELDVPFCLLREHSHRAMYVHGPISLLHIDGNHSGAFLWSDMVRYLPFVCDGGFVAFHDYGNDEPYTREVKRTVDSGMFSYFKEVGVFDTCKVFCKPGPYQNYYREGRP